MDIVYVVREGEDNEELRYSLRSLQNLDHGKVWIFGHKPEWVENVNYVQVSQAGSKYANSTQNLYEACRCPGVSETFVLMNDDMFVMAPMIEPPAMHRGLMDNLIRYYETTPSENYLTGMRETKKLLESYDIFDPVSYEVHAPMKVRKTWMRVAIDLGRQADIAVFHKRTFYGNMWKIGGELQKLDFKVSKLGWYWSKDWPFISTHDLTFKYGDVGEHIRSVFSVPGLYEG